MTLKEKLRQELTGHLSDEKTEVDVNIATAIADEFAIGFAEWLLINDTLENAERWFGYTYKDMLNAYKIEKGL